MRFATNVRLIVEVCIATLCSLLALLTIMWPDWIEELFGFDPDQHSGSVEWSIVIGLALVGVVSAVLARAEWRKLHPA